MKQIRKNPLSVFSLGLHSAAIIAYQLLLMQLISAMQGYHFAYMVISIAMLGFGAGGTFVALLKEKLLKASGWLVPLLMSMTGFFMILSFYLARIPWLQLDIYLLFTDRSQLGMLAVSYILYFIPFFTGALAIGILFIKNADQIGRYYFSNLLGSGVGGLMIAIVLNHFFPLQCLPFIAFMPVVASVFTLSSKKRVLQWAGICMALTLTILSLIFPGSMPRSQYKGISGTLNLPGAEIVAHIPDVKGQIEVVSSSALRYAPALSFTFAGEVPVKKNIFINGDFYGVIPHFDTSAGNIHNYTTEALPYIMAQRDSVLVLNAAGGSAAAHALSGGARHVTGIISTRGVKNLLREGFTDGFKKAALHPHAHFVYQDSRQWLFTPELPRYDAIVLPRMESFGGSTGLNALQEDYALTLEAFQQMWDLLDDGGVISVTTWLDYPARTSLKIAASLAQTLRNNGVSDVDKHLAAIKSWGTLSFVLKKTPLTPEETENIRSFSARMLFDPVLLPDIVKEERSRYNLLEDESLFTYLDAIVSGRQPQLLSDYDFHILPANDNKPYFSRFLKPGTFKKLRDTFGTETMPFLELGYLIVWVTLLQSAILAFLLIILPLLRLSRKGGNKTPTLVYFAALGLGYMFAEIIFIQRFILYFGHPVYAISAAISTMMIASGIGSLYSERLPDALKASRMSTLIIALLLFIYMLVFTPILTTTIQLPLALKVITAFVLLAIPSFFMGIPFPAGIRILYRSQEDYIPWAWGINGCLSVIATSVATLIAVEGGFSAVMIMAVMCYLIAFAAFFRYSTAKGKK